MITLTQELLKALFEYDPITGHFTRKMQTTGRWPIGSKVGTTNKRGYVCVHVGEKIYYAHRLAWLYTYGEWPPKHIDHVDRNKSNNAIANLRLATDAENNQNKDADELGVDWHKKAKKWRARIQIAREQKHLGLFDTFEEAKKAYLEQKQILHPFYAEGK